MSTGTPSNTPFDPSIQFPNAVEHLLALVASSSAQGFPRITGAGSRDRIYDLVANVIIQAIDEKGKVRRRGLTQRLTAYEVAALLALLIEDMKRNTTPPRRRGGR